MKPVAAGLIAATLLFATACNTVHSTEPVGTQVHALDAQDWDGTWIFGTGSTCSLRVTDGAAGELEAAMFEEEDGRLVPRVYRVRLRDHQGWTFASIEDPEQDGLHLWMRIRRDEEQLVLWVPHPERIGALVQEGALPGRVEESRNVVLLAPSDEQLATLHAGLDRELFLWENPLAMIRVTRAH